jgi:hypothetical protein
MPAKYHYGSSSHYGAEICLKCGRLINLEKHGYFRRHSRQPGTGQLCPGSANTPRQQRTGGLTPAPADGATEGPKV